MNKIEMTKSTDEIKLPKAWLKKRKITTYAFYVESFFLGVEYSVFFLTNWLYITTLVKPSNPKLIYSITSTAYMLSGILLSMIIGKVADITREINKLFLLSNVLVVIGNMCYTLNFSVYFVIFGKFIAGAVSPLRCVISGELARSYSPNELPSIIIANGMAFGLGFIFGPATNFLFLSVDIKINQWHITRANAAGIFMAIMFLILAMTMYFLVHNLSKEFDLKSEREKRERKEHINNEKPNINDGEITESTFLLSNVKTKFRNMEEIYLRGEVLLMFFCTFFFLFIITYIDMTLPLIVFDVLKQSMKELNAIILSSGAASIILSIIFIKMQLNQKALFISFLIAIAFCIVDLTTLCLIKANGETNVSNVILWIIFVLCWSTFCIMQEFFLISTFAQTLPSSEQIFGESIRIGFERLGSVLALMVSAYVFDSSYIFSVISCIILVLVIIFSLVKKNSLQNPRYCGFV